MLQAGSFSQCVFRFIKPIKRNQPNRNLSRNVALICSSWNLYHLSRSTPPAKPCPPWCNGVCGLSRCWWGWQPWCWLLFLTPFSEQWQLFPLPPAFLFSVRHYFTPLLLAAVPSCPTHTSSLNTRLGPARIHTKARIRQASRGWQESVKGFWEACCVVCLWLCVCILVFWPSLGR